MTKLLSIIHIILLLQYPRKCNLMYYIEIRKGKLAKDSFVSSITCKVPK